MDEPNVMDKVYIIDGIRFIADIGTGLYARVLQVDYENTYEGKKIVVKKVY